MQTIADGKLIVETLGTSGDRPRIATTRFSVQQVCVKVHLSLVATAHPTLYADCY
jgi:hypothetical protein